MITEQRWGGSAPATAEYRVRPGTGLPATGQTAAGQPATVQPATVQPATVQPATVQPTAGQTAGGQTAGGQTAAGPPAVGRGAAGPRLGDRGAGCSTSAMTRVAMNRAVRKGVPPLVSSLTSIRPRRFTTPTRRPSLVAATS